jgi:hypothetical protein
MIVLPSSNIVGRFPDCFPSLQVFIIYTLLRLLFEPLIGDVELLEFSVLGSVSKWVEVI